MPAIMKILGWRAEGLRCPDHEVDFCATSGVPHRVTLIQMPNGTGKTTTLSLLRAALSGSAQHWDPERIRQFRKREHENSSGDFEVRLLLNDRRVTIIMIFDFETGRVRYKTTYGKGQAEGFRPPLEFRRFLNGNFVNFFVFDGELAQHLLDKAHTDAETVVENLFQISVFKTLEQRVEDYWLKQTQSVKASDERALTRRQNRLRKLKERLRLLEADKKRLEDKRAEYETELTRYRERYNQEISRVEALSNRLTTANLRFEELKSRVREHALDVLDTMRDPHAVSSVFATAMYELKMGLDRVKLPQSVAREFFEELSEEPECVCGRPIDDTVRGVIRSRASKYLGSDDVSLLNSMKTSIQDAVGQSLDEPEKILDHKLATLGELIHQLKDAQQELDSLRIEADQADPAIKDASAQIEFLQTQLENVEHELEKFDDKDDQQGDDRTFGIDVIKRRIEDAEEKLTEITQTLDLKSRRDILTDILKEAHDRARAGIMTEICQLTNKRIEQLIPFNNISVSRIERALLLKGQEGGSVGETLSVAYAFLSTLFNRSEHKLPFIVDSPAGPIDLAVRPKIGELIPKLTNQFIAFTISSEREKFIEPIKMASDYDVQFITLFRKGRATGQEYALRVSGNHTETADGICVREEAFFYDFQLDQEEIQ